MRENMIPYPEEARGDVEVSLQDRDSFPTKPELCSFACILDILAFSLVEGRERFKDASLLPV